MKVSKYLHLSLVRPRVPQLFSSIDKFRLLNRRKIIRLFGSSIHVSAMKIRHSLRILAIIFPLLFLSSCRQGEQNGFAVLYTWAITVFFLLFSLISYGYFRKKHKVCTEKLIRNQKITVKIVVASIIIALLSDMLMFTEMSISWEFIFYAYAISMGVLFISIIIMWFTRIHLILIFIIYILTVIFWLSPFRYQIFRK